MWRHLGLSVFKNAVGLNSPQIHRTHIYYSDFRDVALPNHFIFLQFRLASEWEEKIILKHVTRWKKLSLQKKEVQMCDEVGDTFSNKSSHMAPYFFQQPNQTTGSTLFYYFKTQKFQTVLGNK